MGWGTGIKKALTRLTERVRAFCLCNVVCKTLYV